MHGSFPTSDCSFAKISIQHNFHIVVEESPDALHITAKIFFAAPPDRYLNNLTLRS
jgi:hypothetical protein